MEGRLRAGALPSGTPTGRTPVAVAVARPPVRGPPASNAPPLPPHPRRPAGKRDRRSCLGQHPLGDHDALDLARAFVNRGDAGVPVEALDRILAGVAVSA